MGIVPEYEYVPETTNNEITTVDSLEEYYLLVPDHVKFVYFVYFMVHSSRGEGDDLRVVANEEESEDAKKTRLMTKSSAIVFGAAPLRAPPRVPRRAHGFALTRRSTTCACTRFSTRSGATPPSASSATP